MADEVICYQMLLGRCYYIGANDDDYGCREEKNGVAIRRYPIVGCFGGCGHHATCNGPGAWFEEIISEFAYVHCKNGELEGSTVAEIEQYILLRLSLWIYCGLLGLPPLTFHPSGDIKH